LPPSASGPTYGADLARGHGSCGGTPSGGSQVAEPQPGPTRVRRHRWVAQGVVWLSTAEAEPTSVRGGSLLRVVSPQVSQAQNASGVGVVLTEVHPLKSDDNRLSQGVQERRVAKLGRVLGVTE